ncbi:MAG TPA: tRNA pseudouridine(38-40) synthase TruA [Bryocella sp.]|nr:tRNA pseudouridine(38-40) synthase TruA [Bryocella sp.]
MAAASTNWKLTLAYDGSAFHGWQIQSAQSGLATIQGTLAGALFRLTGEQVLPQGSGRTDAGVHALAQVVSFRLAAPVPAANLQRALNRILPARIRVLSCEQVPHSFHARHSARSKTYEYRIFERRIRPGPGVPATERICSPFLAPYAWDCRWPLSLDAMREAAALLIGTHDFTSMAATDPDRSQREPGDDSPSHRAININPIKTITHAKWSHAPDPCSLIPDFSLLIFRISGSGFLYHMVRNIVGTLVEIGRGSLEPSDLTRILTARDRTAAGPTAPARGLYLVEVLYDPDPTHKLEDHKVKDHHDTGCPIHDDAVGMSGMNNRSDTHDTGSPIHDDEEVDVMSGGEAAR